MLHNQLLVHGKNISFLLHWQKMSLSKYHRLGTARSHEHFLYNTVITKNEILNINEGQGIC